MDSSGPEPSRSRSGWSEEQLTDLHRTLMGQLLRLVPVPLSGAPALVVRGVLQPPEDPAATRVVVWDGRDAATSTAYDLPLTDSRDDSIPWWSLIAALRHLVSGARDRGGQEADAPVVDARPEVLRLLQAPSYDVTDALYSTVSMLEPGRQTTEESLHLSGFLLLDEHTARLYVDTPIPPDRIGLDVALRDENGNATVDHTALAYALPSLVSDELEWNISEVRDPYCSAVYDFTHW
ncbi:hypothetical protein OG520_21030 [Streptomyces sp. NBC_00984]|uniref:hypothetical protein n=1 Tax=Streptomyces sp. NBC_00984 TaxID=2903700 RepID=UPI00386BDD8F|nr:hypothetical protein OG520_21030 [Streptomyces sp. NBC_00984]